MNYETEAKSFRHFFDQISEDAIKDMIEWLDQAEFLNDAGKKFKKVINEL